MTATLSSVHCCLTMMNGTTSGSVQREPRADAKELTSRGQSLIVLLAAAREGECAAPSAGTGQLGGGGGLAITQRGPLPRRFVWQLKEMSKITHQHLVIRLRGRIKKGFVSFLQIEVCGDYCLTRKRCRFKEEITGQVRGEKKTVASITTGNVSGRIMLTLCSIMFPKTETLGTQNERQRRRTKLHENKTSGPVSHSRPSYFLNRKRKTLSDRHFSFQPAARVRRHVKLCLQWHSPDKEFSSVFFPSRKKKVRDGGKEGHVLRTSSSLSRLNL